MPSPGHVYEYVTGEEKAWAALNKQALCRLCDSAEPTKWEQISQDSSESIRGFTQFFLLSTVSCSRLMSSGFEWFWHVGREGNWHANKHAHTHRQTCFACVGIFFYIYFWITESRIGQCPKAPTCFVDLMDLFEHGLVPILWPVHSLRREKVCQYHSYFCVFSVKGAFHCAEIFLSLSVGQFTCALVSLQSL